MKEAFKKAKSGARSFFEAKGTRKAVSTFVGVLVMGSLIFTALLFSSSASAMEEAERIRRTGGDEVKNYISLPNLIRLAYEEPVYIDLHMEAKSTSEEITVSFLDVNGELAVGMPFGIAVTDEDGELKKYLDDDCDGKIEIGNVSTGLYQIAFLPCQGYRVEEDIEVKVDPPVKHVVIDVREQIVNPNTEDVSGEDVQYQQPTRPEPAPAPTPAPGDTVVWVESSKELLRTDTIETPVTDGNGNQLYASVPVLTDPDGDGNRYLILNDGADTVSDIRARVSEDGTLAAAERYVITETANEESAEETESTGETESTEETESAENTEEEPAEEVPEETPQGPVGEWVSCLGEVVDSCGKPVCGSDGETPVYKFSSVTALVTVTEEEIWVLHGWQEIDGNTYYYDIDGNPVTGSQIIKGETYWFNDEGVRSSTQGIDVSTWNNYIDWGQVKASGIDFVIIRVGFRGYSAGKLYYDDMFETYLSGAKAAGLKVGLYFYTQAISELEAVEEASLCLNMINGRSLNYPIFIDMEDAESASARTNDLTNSERTTIINAFCDTIRSGGYRAGLYANSYYLNYKINVSQLNSGTRIWIAHYTNEPHPEYQSMYSMWQYSGSGSVPGVEGDVDLDISYM